MLKLICCVRRINGMSEEEFHHYWREIHGPLTMEHFLAMGACKYVQTYILSTPLNEMLQEIKGQMEPFDGIAEIWWEDIEVLLKAMDTEEWFEVQDHLLSSEEKFIDFSRSCSFLCNEEEMI